ncbi:uncharacterized protein B0H64DRAFT_429052 [Chaetomium fimeti]|uniref:Phospholipase/carboxylesterase/thioesterase domain-containing protein n=1 Tax=Chaetomium fimeti TaxID=1854472 RepID=A0AAE0LXF5_9PEZI|nr:hypothetical protein B0H64DRAFT_429052 [Chaetomium fimeti]
MDPKNNPPAGGRFGSVHIIEPSLEHTHTAIMLHGRGSDGPEFAEELAETMAPGQKPLMDRFPSWRWVFPSSQELWSTAFEEMLPAWFEAHSLTDTSARADLQMGGIRQSVAYIQSILDQEAARLGGETEKVVIMGISQGGAIGMWTMLCQGYLGKLPGAFVGASTWLPFAANIQMLLCEDDGNGADKGSSNIDPSDAFVADMLSTWNHSALSPGADRSLTPMPIFLGHGVDDAVVDVELGRQAREPQDLEVRRQQLRGNYIAVLQNSRGPWNKAGICPLTRVQALRHSSPSQTQMDTFEASKPDRLHQSLSGAWASFLGAQHCSREVDSLKKALDGHVQQTNLSITSLQRDTATKHDLLAASVTEVKSKIEQHAVEIRNIGTLRTDFSTFQYEVGQGRENVARKITDLFDKAVAQQESLDGLRSTTSHDITAIQQQYRSALEKVESLEQELRQARAKTLASEHKLAALENQITAITQTQQQLSEDNVNLPGQIHSHGENLMRLLDKQDLEPIQNSASPSGRTNDPLAQTPAAPCASLPYKQTPTPIVHRDQHDTSEDDHPPARTKRRRLEDPLEQQTKPPLPTHAPRQDIRSLYLVFRDKYKTDPPKSDTVFIWQFISSIEDPAMSKHIQESLATVLPEHVTPSRDMRRKSPLKHVDISKGLTWRKFREALVKIPGPS